MRKKVMSIFWVIGIAALVFLVYRIGPAQIWEHIRRITLEKFLLLFALRFVFFAFKALNWKIVISQYEKGISFPQLLAARITGDAISYLTPSALLGGEPVRAMMVKCQDDKKCFASVVIDKTIEVFTLIFLIIVGISIAAIQIALPRRYKFFFILFAVCAILFSLLILFRQQKGFFSWLVKLLHRFNIRPKFLEKNMENIQETDELISKFYSHHKGIFSIVFVLHSISFMFWIYEIFLTLKLTGAEAVTFLKSFLVTTLGCLVILLPSTPASIGTYEITYVTLIVLVGIAAGAGVTLTLMRRIISVSWAGIGLFLMLMTPRTKKIGDKEIE
ncbi:lysylphosphatidylglycerol synthase transmembrane domain-containing protein [Acidobacteriota bacterium]